MKNSLLNFTLFFNNEAITQKTKLTRKGVPYQITDEKSLCTLMFGVWKKETKSKSFQDWADGVNETGDFESTFTEDDAKDNFNSFFQVNINKKHVDTLEFFNKFYQA